jgi:hypothetical protein
MHQGVNVITVVKTEHERPYPKIDVFFAIATGRS